MSDQEPPRTQQARAAAGDAVAVAVRTAFADAVATAVRFLVLTCDVTHIVLGGGVAQVGLPLRDAVADAIARHSRRRRAGAPGQVRCGAAGRRAGGPGLMEVVIGGVPTLTQVAAGAVERLLRSRPETVLGLATGSSPLAVYDELVRQH